MVGIIIQVIGAYVATITAAITLEAPRSLIFKTGYAGAIGYLVYLLLANPMGVALATFFACSVVSLIGQFFARRFKAPVTIFYIPAFYPFVPGSAIYQTALYFIQGDYDLSNYYLIQTLSIAGAIALGVFFTDSILEIYMHVQFKMLNMRK
ncbi:threonine/serine exporter family protein [Ruoffia tabacinasalis]|uniref:Threonine/serine exporter family protein n=1 Tax=Ruoffia tabacinasalis TaxID=87458 RepID=A0ABS0LLY9_9LACT|nr:threonine/serine exporter family protein [Ruoffia tabacinasalis]MBG9979254.1 threonine/serine exporter family protein [Ruoffia tabacinasalis]